MTQTEPVAAPLAPDPAIVVLTGDIGIADAAATWERVRRVLLTGPRTLILDLGAVTFMDSTGLGTLLRIANECPPRGIRLTVRSPSMQVLRLMHVTGTQDIFSIEA
ncbi:MAG: anti-sigma factor antagonist [Pseudonocardiales bacterium]|nr:anti-sigma factor antagonist [Jatrophihabitantaceae bacterium]MCW2605146.1 anti-sigma factor antagonist [Pseudonocardiales bacterium]